MPADVEPEDVAGFLPGVAGVVGELHAAGLAASARQDLRLDDDLAAEFLRSRAGFLGSRREPALRDWDAEAAKQLLALVLVEIHGRGRVYWPPHCPRPSQPSERARPSSYTRARVPTRVGVLPTTH